MYKSFEEFIQASRESISLFNSLTWLRNFPAKADHLGYKCSSCEEFEYLRRLLESRSCFVFQSLISRRRIVVAKLIEPIGSALGGIWFLELADQKPDFSQTSGFDHIEIYPTDCSVDALVASVESYGVELKKIERPHHTTFDITIGDDFKVRLECGPLVEKIKVNEMK